MHLPFITTSVVLTSLFNVLHPRPQKHSERQQIDIIGRQQQQRLATSSHRSIGNRLQMVNQQLQFSPHQASPDPWRFAAPKTRSKSSTIMTSFPASFHLLVEDLIIEQDHQPRPVNDSRKRFHDDTSMPDPTPLREFKRFKQQQQQLVPKLPCSYCSSNFLPEEEEGEATGEDIRTRGQEEEDDESSLLSEEDVHRSIMAAIFEIGITRASPLVITKSMQRRPPELTLERIKSHLQKFRKARIRERATFLREYDGEFLLCGASDNHDGNYYSSNKVNVMSGGQAAALVVKSVTMMTSEAEKTAPCCQQNISSILLQDQLDENKHANTQFYSTTTPDTARSNNKSVFSGGGGTTKIVFPSLTEKESKSALGTSLLLVKGLIEKMDQNLIDPQQSVVVGNPTTTKHKNQAGGRAATKVTIAPNPQQEEQDDLMVKTVPQHPEALGPSHSPRHHHQEEEEEQLLLLPPAQTNVLTGGKEETHDDSLGLTLKLPKITTAPRFLLPPPRLLGGPLWLPPDMYNL